MLTSRYMASVKNLPDILKKIVEGTAPDKFTVAHLKSLGFKSSNDQGVIALLKDLGFLTPEGAPTQRYLDYRDKSQSRSILGEALREAYGDLFHINENISKADRAAIEGKFKSTHNTSDVVAGRQAMTFLALLDLADLKGGKASAKVHKAEEKKTSEAEAGAKSDQSLQKQPLGLNSNDALAGLRYNIEIHLPATKDVEVYNAIFKSLKEHLIEI